MKDTECRGCRERDALIQELRPPRCAATAPTLYCPAPCLFVVQPSPWQTAIPAYNSAPAPYNNMRRQIYGPHTGGINVVLGDVSVRFVSGNIQPNTWWYALTPAGGEVIPSDW